MTTLLFALAALVAQAPGVDDPWADAVLESVAINPLSGFDFPQRALGAPLGVGLAIQNTGGVTSLGTAGSYLTLKFNTPVADDPRNPGGLDFIVYGNAFWVGGNPQLRWAEPALISISRDANHNGLPDDPWYFIGGSRGYGAGTLPGGVPNPTPPLAGAASNPFSTDSDPGNDDEEHDWGYAELSPTEQPYQDNYLRPDDAFEVGLSAGSGGGDAFDIAWAVDAQGAPANLAAFDFIRIWSFLSGVNAGLGPITPEIDAVADVAPDVDSDGDGILDAYEVRVAGTDPARAESTVIGLEIPESAGGSPAGAFLGEALTQEGYSMALFSAGPRSGARAFNVMVDVLPVNVVLPVIAGRIRTSFRKVFLGSESDFVLAQVAPAVMTLPYSDAMIDGLDPLTLTPVRWTGSAYTQEGITEVRRELSAKTVTFNARYPGTYVLTGIAGAGATPPLDAVWVNFAWTEDELGTYPFPFSSLGEGVAAVKAGGVVKVVAGVSGETGRLAKPMKIQAQGGLVRIGGRP